MVYLDDRMGFRLAELSLPCPGLARPLRVLHLSDTHLLVRDRAKLRFLQRVTNDAFDLVFHTGDVAEEEAAESLVPTMLTRAPRYGAFMVAGNHDHRRLTAREAWGEFLTGRECEPARETDMARMKARVEAGDRWRLLENEAVSLDLDGRTVVIAGVDDPFTRHGDLQKTMHRVKQADALIGLVHVPTDLASFSQRGFHLVFCGHTHGGQIRLPGVGAMRTQCDLPPRLARGVHQVGATTVHVSQGLGAGVIIRTRVFCPPTAYAITLQPA